MFRFIRYRNKLTEEKRVIGDLNKISKEIKVEFEFVIYNMKVTCPFCDKEHSKRKFTFGIYEDLKCDCGAIITMPKHQQNTYHNKISKAEISIKKVNKRMTKLNRLLEKIARI